MLGELGMGIFGDESVKTLRMVDNKSHGVWTHSPRDIQLKACRLRYRIMFAMCRTAFDVDMDLWSTMEKKVQGDIASGQQQL